MATRQGGIGILCSAVLLLGCGVDVRGGDEEGASLVVNHLADITVLGLDGRETDPHVLGLDHAPGVPAGVAVRLELRGPAGVVKVLFEGAIGDAGIPIPPVRVEPGDGPATVDVYVDDRLYGGIDVYTTTTLPDVPPGLEPALLKRGETSMLIDLARTRGVASPAVSGTIAGLGADPKEGPRESHLSSCGNGVFGPGVGRWLSASPGPYGQRFSYAPEDAPSLNWAIQGDREMDALYNQYWGCTSALKNPDNCTTTVSASGVGTISFCCGFPYLSPSWINPSTDPYFRDCPLRR